MQSDHQPDGIGSAESDETSVIYFLMEADKDYNFYRIPDHQPPPSESGEQFLRPVSSSTEDDDEQPPPPPDHNFLQPDFKLDRRGVRSPACAAVGSTMYLPGGDSSTLEGPRSHNELYYIDTCHPEKGWRQGKPMQNPRTAHLALSVNNNKLICAVSGFDHNDCDKAMPIEVFNPEDDSWETKCDFECSDLTDSAVFPGGKVVLLLTYDHKLVIYNVEDDYVGPCLGLQFKDDCYKSLPLPIAIAVLGDETLLYTASFANDGKFQLLGYDFLNHCKKGGCGQPVKVNGLDELMDNRSDYLLPGKTYVIGGCHVLFPRIKLLAIGKNKLAVLWTLETDYYSYVNCLKMDIDREEEGVGSNRMMKLNAHSGSFSSHIVEGTDITQYIPVS